MNSGIFVAKHLQALFEKPEFVADMRDAARYRYNARFLIRANEVAGTDGDIVLFVAYRGIILVLAALDVKPVDNAVSAQTIEHICQSYGDDDLELQFGHTSFFSGLGGKQMALTYCREFPSQPAMLVLMIAVSRNQPSERRSHVSMIETDIPPAQGERPRGTSRSRTLGSSASKV